MPYSAGSPPNFTTPKGYQQLISSQLAGVTSLTVPTGAVRVNLQSNGVQAIRWRDDGGDPVAPAGTTQAIGQRIEAGDMLDYTGDLTKIRVIGEGAGAVLDIAYYG